MHEVANDIRTETPLYLPAPHRRCSNTLELAIRTRLDDKGINGSDRDRVIFALGEMAEDLLTSVAASHIIPVNLSGCFPQHSSHSDENLVHQFPPLVHSVSMGKVPSAIRFPTAQHSYDVDHILPIE